MKINKKGFTLIELILVIAIFLTIAGVLYFHFWSAMKFYRYGFEIVEVAQNSRLAMDRMNRELRLATSIDLAEVNQVEFSADIGSGSQVIRYYFYDPGLNNQPPYYIYRVVNFSSLGDGQPICVVLPDAQAPYPSATASNWVIFNYYDSSGTELLAPLSVAQRSLVKLITINLSTENNRNYRGVVKGGRASPYKKTELRSSVYLRNANN